MPGSWYIPRQPFKVIEIDTDLSAIPDFLLVIHSRQLSGRVDSELNLRSTGRVFEYQSKLITLMRLCHRAV